MVITNSKGSPIKTIISNLNLETNGDARDTIEFDEANKK